MITDSKPQAQSQSASRLKLAREWHLYLGTLFAPSFIFFALTGAIQLFGLHEGRPGGSYQPPVWIQKVASIHKDQNLGEKHGPPPGAGGKQDEHKQGSAGEQNNAPMSQGAVRSPESSDGGGPEKDQRDEEGGSAIPTYVLKWFFLGTALGLVSSTLLGIYMAFKFNRSRALVWSLLILGTVIPVVLVALMA